MLSNQNKMETEAWRVVSRRIEGGGALLVIGIDEMSRGDMVAKGHHLNFRYESILVSGLKETKKAELVENSAPAESKAPVLATQSPPPANKSVPCKLGHSEMLEDLAEDEDLLDLTVAGKMEGGLPCHRRSSRRSSRTAAWMKRT